ncbi:hypothetical protein [Paenibacillus sp. Soil522]|nr:hypothetical protein [Paenibacillus sp. Soil522]
MNTRNNGRYTFSGKAYNGSSIDWETNEQALNYNSPSPGMALGMVPTLA